MYRVLMPIDRSEKRVLAQAQAATELPAAPKYVEVTLLYVLEEEAEDAESFSVRQLASGERAIEYLAENDSVASVDTELRRGEAAEEILDAAETRDADVVVLGGRKRSPTGTLLFGSVSTDVALRTNRPVMITGDQLEASSSLEEEDEPHPTPRQRDDGEEVPDVRPPTTERQSSDEKRNPPDFSSDRE